MDRRADIRTVIDTIAERIRERRKVLGLTQEKLAERAGLSVNYLAQLEISDKTPSLKTLASLASALEIEIADFFASRAPEEWTDEVNNLLRRLREMKASDVKFVLTQLDTIIDYLKWERDE